MPDKLGVAIAGLDHWYMGLGELEALQRSQRAQVVALAHRDRAKAEALAQRYHIPFVTTDYQAVVTREEVEIVLTACPTSENAALCRAAAAAGKHIVSVKPIAMTTAEARTIREAVRQAGVHFISYESAWRLNPVYRAIQEWVAAGRIGPVLSALTILRAPLPTQPWPGERGQTWWLDPTRAPAGGWLDHAIYHIDFLRWLLQDEVASVSGVVATLKHRDLAFEDYGVALLTFHRGVQATVEDTWTAPPGGSLSQVQILGQEGQIVYDPTLSGKLAVAGRFDLAGWLLTAPPTGPVSVVDHLATVLQEAVPPVATVDDAVRNLEVGFAFYTAARQGAPVVL